MDINITYSWYSYKTSIYWNFFGETVELSDYSEEGIKNKVYLTIKSFEERENNIRNTLNQIFTSIIFTKQHYYSYFSTLGQKYFIYALWAKDFTHKIKEILNLIDWYHILQQNPSEERAKDFTKYAIQQISDIDNILKRININPAIERYNKLEVEKLDLISEFNLQESISNPILKEPISYPNRSDKKYNEMSAIDYILNKNKKIQENDEIYQQDYAARQQIEEERIKSNEKIMKEHEEDLNKYKEKIQLFEKIQVQIEKEQNNKVSKIHRVLQWYSRWLKDDIEQYMEIILMWSNYPIFFPKEFVVEYNEANNILIVDYFLPSIETFPTLNEIRFIKSKQELKEFHLKDNKISQLFEFSCYATVLRIIKEIFINDYENKVSAVSLNWWVNNLNKATWKKEDNCILSIQVKKDDFIEIELENVDAKACFKNLKWVGSSKISWITPVTPILQTNKIDKRFSQAYEVVNKIDNTTNLAAMDREDFENLVREVFEKEFSTNGWEVKITQASKDWWVDAVAFDPDPIRWWKIVIQAKRYTNTVWVSAVRDLYWTVMNEWATKGILVTTSDYWPDAYEFAKWKPLTLLNGANLLYLLEKHWHTAKIDIREARKILNLEK